MDDSIFVKTFGNYPLIRVLDFLIEHREFDYPQTDIAKNANVNFATLKTVWPQASKLLVCTRRVGNAQMYKLDVENPIVKKLIELDNFLSKQYSEQILKEQSKSVAATS